MKLKFITVLILLLIIACNPQLKNESSLLDFIPEKTSILIKINNFNNLQSEIKNNDLLNSLKSLKLYKEISDKTNILKYISPSSESLLAFSNSEDGTTVDMFFITKDSLDYLKKLASVINKKKLISHKNKSINEFTLKNSLFYCINLDNNFMLSSSKSLIEEVINKEIKDENKNLEKLYKTTNNLKPCNILINTKENNLFFNQPETKNFSYSNFIGDWISLDGNINQSKLNFIGIGTSLDSISNTISLFKNTTPIHNTVQEYAPKTSEAILSFSFNDYSIFAQNRLNHLRLKKSLDTIFSTVEEIGIIYFNSKKSIILQTYGADNISEHLTKYRKTNIDFKSSQITALNNPNIISGNFNPLVNSFESNYYTIIGNAFIFSEDIETLQNIIDNFKNGTTFNKSSIYSSAKETIANESSILYICKNKKLKQNISNLSKTSLNDFDKIKLSDYFFAKQIVADKNFYHINLTIQKIKKENKSNTISPIFNIQLDNDLATDPQFVVNHRTNKKEIVVQDTENQLYLISTEGKVIWKKKLNGQVQGKIEQVDIYKNGKLQLAFTTNNQFLILDRNGKNVEPFNIMYEGGNLNPLAVFDYENNKNYRFVVTQGQKVFMYNSSGNIVSGFTYIESKSPIIQKPEHFRTNNKDYLTFMLENGDLKILNRIGKERVNVKNKINFSENGIKLYKNKFSITDNEGTLHQIATNGKTLQTKLKLSKNHSFEATNNTMVTIDENKVSIKGKKVNLELGVFNKPQIFYIKNKIYISITDIQNQKIYLFDSNAKAIQNFPINGSSKIDLSDMDNDEKLEVISKDTDNSIIVYKIN